MLARNVAMNRFLLVIGAILAVILLLPARAQAQTDLGDCTFEVDEGMLSVLGGSETNVVAIDGFEGSIRVACDGDELAFDALAEIVIRAGEGGDSILVDNESCALNRIPISVDGEEGDDGITVIPCADAPSDPSYQAPTINGGSGVEVLWIVNTATDELQPLYSASITARWNFEPAEPSELSGPSLLAIDTEIVASTGIEQLIYEDGPGGGEVIVDNENCGLNQVAIEILGQGGDDGITVIPCADAPSDPSYEAPTLIGGSGVDILKIVNKAIDELQRLYSEDFLVTFPFTEPAEPVGPSEQSLFAIIYGTVIATGTGIEQLNLEDGPGGGEIIIDNSSGLLPSIVVSGQGGEDDVTLLLPREVLDSVAEVVVSGGPDVDKFSVVGDSDHEDYAVTGLPDRIVPDPHIRVTNLLTEKITGNVFVQETEEIRIESGGGDDQLNIAWDPASMRGVEQFQAVLGEGDDSLALDLLPVFEELDGVQQVIVDVVAGKGDDAITFEHSAGGWLDFYLAADLGLGDDMFSGVFDNPPDDGVPGPEGSRDVNLEVAAGDEDDTVIVHNRTGQELIDLLVTALFEGGEDFLEAIGEMELLADPGSGFDTARVTRNLRRFVREFELVVLLED